MKGGFGSCRLHTMSINIVNKIDNLVKVQHVLVSVSDKTDLEHFVPELLDINPEIHFLSTGGTFSKLKEILGTNWKSSLTQVSDYTGQPETQGGLVKTLDFKIYLGLLTETYNDAHQADLQRTSAVPIDMVVVNLYPFQQTIAKQDTTPEMARGNIDIGGPCMIRASAKNHLRVASVVDPADYPAIISCLKNNNGCTTLDERYKLACKAFGHTAEYDAAIAEYLTSRSFDVVRRCYSL